MCFYFFMKKTHVVTRSMALLFDANSWSNEDEHFSFKHLTFFSSTGMSFAKASAVTEKFGSMHSLMGTVATLPANVEIAVLFCFPG